MKPQLPTLMEIQTVTSESRIDIAFVNYLTESLIRIKT